MFLHHNTGERNSPSCNPVFSEIQFSCCILHLSTPMSSPGLLLASAKSCFPYTASPTGAKPTNRIKSWLSLLSETVFLSLTFFPPNNNTNNSLLSLSRCSTAFTLAVIKRPNFECFQYSPKLPYVKHLKYLKHGLHTINNALCSSQCISWADI